MEEAELHLGCLLLNGGKQKENGGRSKKPSKICSILVWSQSVYESIIKFGQKYDYFMSFFSTLIIPFSISKIIIMTENEHLHLHKSFFFLTDFKAGCPMNCNKTSIAQLHVLQLAWGAK